MRELRSVAVALLGCLSLASIAGAQEGAHQYYEHAGAWQIISNVNAVRMTEDFWMASKAIEHSGIFSLDCKVDTRRYAFVIGDMALAHIPLGADVVLDVRAANDKPFKIGAKASGNGNLIVDEIDRQPSFTALLSTIFFINPEPRTIGFALGPQQWFFSLAGFRSIAEKLGKHCGFNPDPSRARKLP